MKVSIGKLITVIFITFVSCMIIFMVVYRLTGVYVLAGILGAMVGGILLFFGVAWIRGHSTIAGTGNRNNQE